MECMMFSETFCKIDEESGEKQMLSDYIKHHQLWKENDDYWKLVIIYNIWNSLMDEEESSKSGSDSS